jgi:hypothetical protein
MRETVVEILTSFGSSQPLLVAVLLLLGSFTLLRAFIHKAKIFTDQFTVQIRGAKGELRELIGSLKELTREVTRWKAGP